MSVKDELSCAPIVITVYDRYDHLKRCVEALLKNDLSSESELFILSDAPSNPRDISVIEKIRGYVKTIKGFKKVNPVFWVTNKGGHASITDGLNMVLEEYDSFISLEDDIVVSPNFLRYMNDGLKYYANDQRVFSICGYKLPFSLPANYEKDIFFYPCNSPWGTASWKNRWEKVDHSYFDRYSELKRQGQLKAFCSIGFYIKGILMKDSRKEIVADDLRVYYHMFQNNLCSVFPVTSKSQNWGFDGSGEHCGDQSYSWTKPMLENSLVPVCFEPFTSFDREILARYRRFQNRINGGFLVGHLKYTWAHDLYRQIKKKFK